MGKLYTLLAALVLAVVLTLPGPSAAADKRADGARTLDQHEFSSHRRRYRHRHVVRRHYYRGPRVTYRRYYRPYYAAPFVGFPFAFGAPYYAPRYYYRPRYYYPAYYGYYPRRYWGGSGLSISFGFGPRYWW